MVKAYCDEEIEEIDTLTPEYIALMKNLSPQQRRILVSLARAESPQRISNISELARITQYGIVSTQVGRLVKKGVLEKKGRGVYYFPDNSRLERHLIVRGDPTLIRRSRES
ncbi:MAG: helix-turn-helix domain-containing protein [Candidatus Pacearchaeota archaeon]